MATLDGPHILPKSSTQPTSLVILLHGRGASGDDLIGLGGVWLDVLPETAFYSPHAPYPFEEAPFGRQWYSRRSGEDWAGSVRPVEAALNAYIDELLAKHEIPASRCVLAGFSQGTIVALHVAPRRHNALGCVVGFSGRMVAGDTLPADLANKTPICLIHGANDPVLPHEGSEEAGQLLEALEVPAIVHILPGLAHSIDERAGTLGAQFIMSVFDTATNG